MTNKKQDIKENTEMDGQDTPLSEESSQPSLEQKLEAETSAKLQIMADFQNFKKRMDQERSTYGAIATMSIIQDFLETYDDLSLALTDQELTLEAAKTAITTAQSKLLAAVSSAGVEPLEVSVGDDFDSTSMEAITTIPDSENVNKVAAIIGTGFKYSTKEGVIKPSKVVVGK